MRTVFQLVVILVSFVHTSPILSAEDEPTIEVNAFGEPPALSKGNAIRYFLWYDAAGWHLQTDTAGKAHEFTGLIDVVGGKVTSISDFENLEAGKKKKKSDVGMVNQAKNQITFKFTTSKKRDGFDFQVDDSAKQIRLKLLIDGKASPDRVVIGAAGQPAPTEVLLLPAHPK